MGLLKNIIYYLDMWLKILYYGLIILSSQTMGQNLQNSQEYNRQEHIDMILQNSQLKECVSGPIIWSNCPVPGPFKFPAVSQ